MSLLREDIEMQQRATTKSDSPLDTIKRRHRNTDLACLFGVTSDVVARWVGAAAYCQFLEDREFKPLLSDEYAFIWKAIGEPRPTVPAECWPWFRTVCSALHLVSDTASIEDICDQVRYSALVDTTTTPHPTDAEKLACLIGVFSVLCWGSMTLTPILHWKTIASPPRLLIRQSLQSQNDHHQQGLKIDIVRRPVHAIFRNFRKIMTTSRWRQPIGGSISGDNPKCPHCAATGGVGGSTVLYKSTLNYDSLKTIGKIRLRWVHELSSHLDFDSQNRCLYIFRFPSFCALGALGKSRAPIFDGLVRALYSTQHETTADSASEVSVRQLSQEILMSYRILFAQTRGSRRLAGIALEGLQSENPHHYDSLLELVCTAPLKALVEDDLGRHPMLWPVSCRTFEDVLQEQDTYSSQDDFPLLGQRLVKLQEFNLRQQPSRLRDLWRDRRNVLQWYTFWAVLVVGGFSLLLALLSLGVAIAQLITSVA
ncbi:hypothetical protein KVR01_009536 [Diaporthe batatas]|uniref:uncharacterized protein n=1 Tax=Diaporthe batatas TaxID=748121 RepID=UPI001D03EE5A|nr:uncharacterized protein KVR01_009536 [Diaporthe batatas]KAG8161272.1 hypothetical protein KVR01_009536 [Diaporthe batatas]